jgi:hypothetical protein
MVVIGPSSDFPNTADSTNSTENGIEEPLCGTGNLPAQRHYRNSPNRWLREVNATPLLAGNCKYQKQEFRRAILTNQRTTWSGALLEKLTVTQLDKKLPGPCGNPWFLAVFTRARF